MCRQKNMDVVYYNLSNAVYDPRNYSIQMDYTKSGFSDNFYPIPNGISISLYPTDKPFKKNTDTLPRAELRTLTELPLSQASNDTLHIAASFRAIDNDTAYQQLSYFQVFANHPEIMLRTRLVKDKLQPQLLVFNEADKQKKITPLQIDMTKSTWIDVYFKAIDRKRIQYRVVIHNSDHIFEQLGFMKTKLRDKTHIKLGPYAQGVPVSTKVQINYTYLSHTYIKS